MTVLIHSQILSGGGARPSQGRGHTETPGALAKARAEAEAGIIPGAPKEVQVPSQLVV